MTAEETDYLGDTFERYEINTPLRKVHFVSTVYHESQGFTRFIENLNYSAQGLANTFPKRYSTNGKPNGKPNALAIKLDRKPEAIANNLYANRLGNGDEASGDGWKYRGAGAIQLTGKENQTKYFENRGLSLLPKLLQNFEYAIDSAGWFWRAKGCNELADTDNVTAVRKRVNGGVIGLSQVKELVEKYKGIYI